MSRLPAVKPLSEMLPKGAEGGKEFARIVDLLLFYDARKNGGNVTLFSDRSGDTYGLDAFDSSQNGYQYKFFPSPLSDAHRSEIVKSLQSAIAAHEKSGIKKWLLGTPDNLVNSGRKNGGGDVQWFSNLRKEHNAPFEIEHIGHTKIQALFLQSDALCLHYYPDIIPNGVVRQEYFQRVRRQYDDNLRRRYNHIEFVGMSVRKEDATRGLPMENIYIPLDTVAEGTADDDDKAPRINPLEFVRQGQRTVILGDPGSGKSTMLRFLALAGISPNLQKRYSAKEDGRLSIIVTLRRYSDALKSNKQIPLIDYIADTAKADFSIPEFSADFIRNYLEAGQAVLFFDGVDELPDLSFKTLIRERVQSLVTSFPGNAAIVTSRIAGYDAEARFGGTCSFDHWQMAPLRKQETRRFAEDWHAARTENEKDRENLVADLMRILTDADNQAIRELARNPLLLTIMVLVHRIDAVLPDQRVVLYQKCVETLMISWQARKANIDSRKPGKDRTDQRHLRRLAAIAQWMHEQAGGSGVDRRATVPAIQLRAMLTNHLKEVERWQDREVAAEDEAEFFLCFVRERAGLLIESGPELYSFVHLTFQEYLSARHIIIQSEIGGDQSIWQILEPVVADPRWREVIRLLVAERQSEESQRNLVGKILAAREHSETPSNEAATVALTGGLLIDRIPAATERAADILTGLLLTSSRCADDPSVSALLTQLATLMHREDNAGDVWNLAVRQALELAQNDSRLRAGVVLAALTAPLPLQRAKPLMEMLRQDDAEAAALADGLLWEGSTIASPGQAAIQRLYRASQYYVLTSSATNFATSVFVGSLPGQNKKLVLQIMLSALGDISYGPWVDFIKNTISFHILDTKNSIIIRDQDRVRVRDQVQDRDRLRVLDQVRDRVRIRDRVRDRVRDLELELELDRVRDRVLDRDRVRDRVRNRVRVRVRDRVRVRVRDPENIWENLADERQAQDSIIDAIVFPLKVSHVLIWREVLRRHFLPNLRKRHTVFHSEGLAKTNADISANLLNDDAIWCAACWLMLDLNGDINVIDTTALSELERFSNKIDHPILTFVVALRHALSGDEYGIKTVKSMIAQPHPILKDLLKESCWVD